jgi:hypothetical protein
MAKRSDRTTASATAWIVINGRADCECSVLDLSPAGAKVVVKDGSGIPERFELAFFQDASKGRQMRCDLAPWHSPQHQICLRSGTVLAPKIGSYFPEVSND